MLTTGKAFIHDDFLLTNAPAKRLYHEFAKDKPILDYHCHVSPHEIADDRRYNNISEVWLHGDHYKWRAMRALGIDEDYVTGNKSDKDKFLKWAEAVPHTMGNPLYHWTHLELKRYFGVDELLNQDSAERIWTEVNERLQDKEMSTRGIIEQSNVHVICTTDDPIDSLESHKKLAAESGNFKTKVYPAFRPDKVLAITTEPFLSYIKKLSEASQVEITSYQQLLKALEERADFFHAAGCRLSDHGIDTVPYKQVTESEAANVFEKALNGSNITADEELSYQAYTMQFLGRLYHKHGWTMQLHLGAARNNNSRMFKQLGADTGFDSMGDAPIAESLNGFLNELEKTNELPKSIIYTVNPIYNEVIATAIGNFQSSGTKGKIQFGSGWWFNDQKDGMIKQLKDLSNIGLLSTFVGMLTDSRSFLSYTRHEYFRRVLCDLVGGWIEAGEAPEDYEWIGQMIENICYHNAEQYFEFA
ncbi:glucuronate isomerase [Alkalicoccobacillus porphyridii]|uniref:Uronate isomerase n=1 Tax=Alkalicoccobacillus porphyridii TaxID=2597270 RepID=A0A553ZVP9_9BACI|nr:glucuronate isomerase [Alkalicoccobacillus porphyridii]TSB45415.1 glucuronate isomerase [Alkalicoccobacillus porphyridii]